MYAGVAVFLTALVDEGPDPKDVVAGWTGFVVFVGLIIAVAVLGWSLTKHLRKVDRAEDEGVFGEPGKKPSPGPRPGE